MCAGGEVKTVAVGTHDFIIAGAIAPPGPGPRKSVGAMAPPGPGPKKSAGAGPGPRQTMILSDLTLTFLKNNLPSYH